MFKTSEYGGQIANFITLSVPYQVPHRFLTRFMDFPFADPPGIVRANQKDEQVQHELSKKIIEILQPIKGIRFIHRYKALIETLSLVFYLGLTTLSGSRTLGEEYTDIFYLTPDRRLPRKLKLWLYVVTSGLAPFVIPKLTAKIRQLFHRWGRIRSDSLADHNLSDESDNSEESSFVFNVLSSKTWTSINLAIFYLTGTYYQLGKRFFGLRYAFSHRVDPLSQPNGSYELISVLMITRALFKLVVKLRERLPRAKEEEVDSKTEVTDITEMGVSLEDTSLFPYIHDESRRCNLCLELMRAPTVTICGHLYCWACISEWCRKHSECPLCRQSCHEQHLLELCSSV